MESSTFSRIPTTTQMSSVGYKVFAAARDDMSLTLYAMLSQKPPGRIHDLLSELTTEEDQTATPLIIAAKNGHSKVVKMLLNFFRPHLDIEQAGTVKFDGFTIEGATALWCSSGAGHYDVVEALLDNDADVNHGTLTNSTPLRAACFDGRLDIVKFLLSRGADINIPNKYQNSCLMIASYKGHGEVVRYLLENSASPNDKAHCGATALHFAAELGFLPIVKDLVQFGGTLTPNEQGMTALHMAAENGQADVVEFFVSHSDISKIDGIEAIELLGAHFANDKDNYHIEKCYHFLWLAMQERYRDTNNIIHKTVLPPVEAYNNQVECQNIRELDDIQRDHDAVHMEALIIRERILGVNNSEIPHPVIYRGAVFADGARFDRCEQLWYRALALQQQNNRSIAKDLMRFAQLFSQMIHIGVPVEFKSVFRIFTHIVRELQRDLGRSTDVKIPSEEKEFSLELLDLNIHCALYLLMILLRVDNRSKEQEFDLCREVYKFNKLDLRLNSSRLTPLHMACDENTAVDDFHVNDVVSFPSDALVTLLVKCGADVNAVDCDGNTPLHVIVQFNRPISDFLILHNIIIRLLGAGTHIDRRNHGGETAMDYTTTGVAEIIIRSMLKLSLKCMAARAVRRHNIPYQGLVPRTLEEFVSIH